MSGCVATIGMFDGVHQGHRFLLEQVKSEASARGLSTLVVTFAEHPLSLIDPSLAPRRLTGNDTRRRLLLDAGIDCVETLVFDSDLRAMTAGAFMSYLRGRYGVEVLVMGFNHRFGHDRLATRGQYIAAGRAAGVDVVFAEPCTAGAHICSSAIRTALSSGDIALANSMLGRPYRLRGRVVDGKRLGRTIGYPTANISLNDSAMLVPARGVYAVDVTLPDGLVKRGMLNIGVRPTVDDSVCPVTTLEVNIIGWSGSVYGETLDVAFVARLRDERRFDGVGELKKQLDDDRRAALEA